MAKFIITSWAIGYYFLYWALTLKLDQSCNEPFLMWNLKDDILDQICVVYTCLHGTGYVPNTGHYRAAIYEGATEKLMKINF